MTPPLLSRRASPKVPSEPGGGLLSGPQASEPYRVPAGKWSWPLSPIVEPRCAYALETSRAIYSSTCAATDGPDKLGHDDVGTSGTIGQTPDFAVVSEMCASRRDEPGHGRKKARPMRPNQSVACYSSLFPMTCL